MVTDRERMKASLRRIVEERMKRAPNTFECLGCGTSFRETGADTSCPNCERNVLPGVGE
jgi:rubrerythrin